MKKIDDLKVHKLKTIWQEKGIDEAMTVCKKLGFKRYQAWQLIESWMFPKEHDERRSREEAG